MLSIRDRLARRIRILALDAPAPSRQSPLPIMPSQASGKPAGRVSASGHAVSSLPLLTRSERHHLRRLPLLPAVEPISPRGHQFAPFHERIAAPVGPLRLVADRMRERGPGESYSRLILRLAKG